MSAQPEAATSSPVGEAVIRVSDGSEARGRIIDISLGGALLHIPPTSVPLVDGTLVMVELVLTNEQRFTMSARLHLRDVTTFVVVFIAATPEVQATITSLVVSSLGAREDHRERVARIRDRRAATRRTFSPFDRKHTSQRILVVDDEEDVRELLVEMLQASGYEADSARDGDEALTMLRARPDRYGVILLDFSMPKMDGYIFRRIQQSDPEIAKIPVILSSAAEPRYLPPLDVDAQLTKPLSAATLVMTIESCLAAHKGPISPTPS